MQTTPFRLAIRSVLLQAFHFAGKALAPTLDMSNELLYHITFYPPPCKRGNCRFRDITNHFPGAMESACIFK